MIEEVESHEFRSHLILMKKSEVNNKHKNKYGNLKTILSIWYFNRNIFTDGRLMKQKSRLCSHGEVQQWGDKYW